ncbi:hypothetical protein S40288_08161 [Stachybotrys chartarum IBT 40288]|nr:hypothetical protein S40288_08161 [Stachybotrys chartarum IBT 40288]
MGKPLGLIPNLQLCLAHYCDTHGPTPLMVTEGLTAQCTICLEAPFQDKDDTSLSTETRPCTSPPNANSQPQTPAAVSDGLGGLNLVRAFSCLDVDDLQANQRPTVHRSSTNGTVPVVSPAPLETPPDSPRPTHHHPRRDSSYRRTYDETVTKRQGPCDNCAMTLPKRQAGVTGNVDSQAHARGPTLRTRAPAERVFGPGGHASPPASQASSDTDSEIDDPRRPRNKKAESSIGSRGRSTSSNSTRSERPPYHVHYVDYTSTHEPTRGDAFSILRASCLRALSFETLPRAPAMASPTSSPLTTAPPPFVTTQSAGSAVSGGPIFFGDALAGYTTAYIFRIPDVHARGHKRVYAFLALSTHKERLAMKTFAVVSAAFRDLAGWIQQLAEAEADRAAAASPITVSLHSNSGYPKLAQSAFDASAAERGGSSFLTGGSGFTRRMGGAVGASAPKARGLAELVGQPDFFIELHEKFVRLLFEVGITLSS